jgi:DNA-binding GntR family transcriptional regulator
MSASSEQEQGEVQATNGDRKGALAHALRHRILMKELAPGAVLDETALGDEFGLSRVPVRELMRQMAAEGYIELEANRAARVSAMSYESLRNFHLAAPLIYIATTKLAAMNATPDEIAALRRIQEGFRAAVEGTDIDGRVSHNDQFHLAIGHMARNPYLLPSLRRLLIDHARLGKTYYNPHDQNMARDIQSSAQQHDDIIDAIERRDPDAAAEIVRAHLDLSRKNMGMFVSPAGIEVPFG